LPGQAPKPATGTVAQTAAASQLQPERIFSPHQWLLEAQPQRLNGALLHSSVIAIQWRLSFPVGLAIAGASSRVPRLAYLKRYAHENNLTVLLRVVGRASPNALATP
jgi:hypothetical protein